ncbi:MAG: acyl-CoA dehydrogenase family protein, partial [Ketobacter sp.]|nr:acyl-CoA dehydrogenase family protein [Ketobacter sp.]
MTDYQRYFGETQNLVRESVRTFVAREISPNVERWEEAGELPRDLYQKAGDAGILGIGYPEQYGGTGFDMFSKIAASEEIMAAGSGGVAASLGSIDIGLPPVVKWGSDALKARICPDVIAGRKIQCLAITEPGGGSDVANLRTKAAREGDHFVVNGSKTFITSGVNADYYTVAVRTGDPGYGGISLLLVEKGTPGFGVGRKLKKMGWWASDTA